jgi:hypothetical protein
VEVNGAEVAGAIGGISLAALGFGAVFLGPGLLSARYQRELLTHQDGPSADSAGPGGSSYDKALAKYASHGLAQSWISFIVSVLFAGLGFVVILTGVLFVTFRHGSLTTAAVSALSGTVVEAVAGLFFALNRMNQKNMIGFYDRLRSDQRVEHAINMARKLPESYLATRLQALLALRFTETDPIAELFQQLLRSEEPPGDGGASAVQFVPRQGGSHDGPGSAGAA